MHNGVGESVEGLANQHTCNLRTAPDQPHTSLLLTGDGIVVVIDGARFLPASTTITRVLASVWSSSGALLAGPYEGVSQPNSDARWPAYNCKLTLDAVQNGSSFDDPTATLLMQVGWFLGLWVVVVVTWVGEEGSGRWKCGASHRAVMFVLCS